jgi:ankyrin repeat protein
VHLGVLRNDLDLLHDSFRYGFDINMKDMNGHAPIHLAIKKQAPQAIERLLQSEASTELTAARDWLKAYRRSETDIVVFTEDASGKKLVSFVSANNFEGAKAPTTYSRKTTL